MSNLATQLIEKLSAKGWQIRAAESCTAGLIMAELTSISGASAVVDRGFVTYSNEAKQDMLGVQEETLKIYGAVSAETAFEMVKGCAAHSATPSAALSVTGVAGPNGGTKDKPVGTVWIGTLVPHKDPLVKHYLFSGNRDDVRAQTVQAALTQLIGLLD